MMVSVSLPLFLALTVLASVGLGYVCCVIEDSLAQPDRPFEHPDVLRIGEGREIHMEDCDIPAQNDEARAIPFDWSSDDVTLTVHEIREL